MSPQKARAKRQIKNKKPLKAKKQTRGKKPLKIKKQTTVRKPLKAQTTAPSLNAPSSTYQQTGVAVNSKAPESVRTEALSNISIPNRFESLYNSFSGEIRPLIVPIDSDLKSLTKLREKARIQNGGLLALLHGDSGIGKTTAVHSAAVHMPELFTAVVSVPPTIDLRAVPAWLQSNLPTRDSKRSILVLFDGREVSDDKVGLKQLLASLNQQLRQRSDVIFCWPTTDKSWQAEIRDIASRIGGGNFIPADSDIAIHGPPKEEWSKILERLLLRFSKTYDDIGITTDLVQSLCAESDTIGALLGKVGGVIADRISNVQATRRLPRLLFVVTSSGDVNGEANRIRRAGNQILAPEPLLGHSPRSESGKWWQERNKNPNHHLGYMISLFEARLVTMGPSSVVYACLHHDDGELCELAVEKGARKDAGNARRTLMTTDLYRFLLDQTVPEFTSTRKGRILNATKEAYAGIQSLSSKHHKKINTAICSLLSEHLPSFKVSPEQFEVNAGEQNLFVDAITDWSGATLNLEFHHLSEAHCKAASMASYIMDKLRAYSIHYNLIPR
ncbi:hypothetical protein [Archangium lansingense]|uniref:ATP-binding protein n=1 Tax=Archangium lansingense TaxID=2995310 RepID=A0ABT4AMC7_9BACT|nr:hypothetical protein [Archangium lansinium]MCY1082810.1 hypothetical protein [Archangium lansinium]